MTTWRVDYTTEGFTHPDQPEPVPVAVTEEQAEYAAAVEKRQQDETRRRGW